MSFRLEKKFVGRKAGKKCVKQTAANKKKKKCSQFKPVGAVFSGGGAAGPNTVTLPNGKKLKPGSYKLTMTARDVAGNETVATTTFNPDATAGDGGRGRARHRRPEAHHVDLVTP